MRPKVYSIADRGHGALPAEVRLLLQRVARGQRRRHGGRQRRRGFSRASTSFSRSLDVDHVTITGGEPFARRDLFELLDLVKARGVGIQIISNGGLIDDASPTRLAPTACRYVQVTLDGPDAALHDEHVGGDGHFEKTIARHQRARARTASPSSAASS